MPMKSNLAQMSAALEKATHRAAESAALIVEAEVKARTPVDTGRLRKSVTHKVQSTGSGAKATVGTDVNYAPYIEFGTRKMKERAMFRKGFKAKAAAVQEIVAKTVKGALE